jgi:hypothetical protein
MPKCTMLAALFPHFLPVFILWERGPEAVLPEIYIPIAPFSKPTPELLSGVVILKTSG